MTTNTVQLHKKVKYWLDQSRSPRFRKDHIDEALNDAIDTAMKNRFIAEGPNDEQRGFQRNRVLRDELRPLVKKVSISQRNYGMMSKDETQGLFFTKGYYYKIVTFDQLDVSSLKSVGAPGGTGTITVDEEFEATTSTRISVEIGTEVAESIPLLKLDSVNSILLSGWFPSDYNYYALIRLIINGQSVDPFEITYEQVAHIMQDPFLRPSIDYPPKTYHFESNEGFKLVFGDKGIVTDVELYYLARPKKVKYGKERVINTLSSGTDVILGQDSVIQNTVEYSYGDEFKVPATPDPNNTVVVINTVSSDLPESLMKEIVQEAARILLVTVEKAEKAQTLPTK